MLILFSNAVNIDRHNPHKQKFFGALNHFFGPETKKSEHHWSESMEALCDSGQLKINYRNTNVVREEASGAGADMRVTDLRAKKWSGQVCVQEEACLMDQF